MKVYIRHNATTKTGYEVVSTLDNGEVVVTELNRKTTDNYLYMPDHVVQATNRRLIGIALIEKSMKDGEFEVEAKEYRAPRVLGPRDENGNHKKLEDYLTDEEKSIIANIMAEAKKRKEADKPKPLTEVEKAQREYEKAKAKLEKLMGAQA